MQETSFALCVECRRHKGTYKRPLAADTGYSILEPHIRSVRGLEVCFFFIARRFRDRRTRDGNVCAENAKKSRRTILQI